ncbi:hypothetical protein [Hymenobacter arizonensis]|uniref:Uncharacterized protein n=1 Tax=Hymenobacter arizonensis TaxID=1227077 RepID=A0A1I6BGL8_HYMAR|nr:hypothetical protein [Hymenobacter arizonensis]SFQ80066.1 hypothetical protein SAMN04515668_4535 [Hymenobacter arizonensis]
MALLESVKLYAHDNDFLGRLELSVGSELMQHVEYHKNSYGPINSWVKPSPEDIAILAAPEDHLSDQLYNKTIGIFKLPDEIIAVCKNIDFDSVLFRKDLQERFSKEPTVFQAFEKQIGEYIEQLKIEQDSDHIIHAMPILANPHITMTRKFISGVEDYLFCGLHVDGDSGDSLEECASADNRISINLTSEPRVLLFINISVDDILNKYAHTLHLDTLLAGNRDALVRAFFEANPHYPVVKIIIKPYELYVAPTDNLIHDGSIGGRKQKDVTLVALGRFSPISPAWAKAN